MELVFVRHGESEANVLARGSGGGFCCGRWDCELTETGREQAARLKGNPEVSGADAIFSSPLKRAYETASAFADGPIIRDACLMERTLGDFDGKWNKDLEKIPEYAKYFDDDHSPNFRGGFYLSTPNGESYADVVKRVTPFFKELYDSGFKKVVIVSHAIAIRCMLYVVSGLSEEETIKYKVKQCEPITVIKEGGI